MLIRKFLNHLRTFKRFHVPPPSLHPSAKIADAIITTVIATSTSQLRLTPTRTTLLYKLTPGLVQLILSDPHLETPKCLYFFNFLVKSQSLMSFDLNIEAHLTIICRLVRARKFKEAENLMGFVLNDGTLRYPFTEFTSFVENHKIHSRVATKVFNLMLKVYSDNTLFAEALKTFEYMRASEIRIDERTCTVHLIELMRCHQPGLGLEFFYRMVDSGIEISVFSLTVVVDGLCKSGQTQRARELVEEMADRKIKPNIITINTMIDACTKRWNFEELDKVLALMNREGVVFNDETYKFLIDGFLSYGKVEDAERMVFQMFDEGFKVDTHTYNMIMSCYCRIRDMERAVSVFSEMLSRGSSPNVDSYAILVDGFRKAKEMEGAKNFFAEMLSKGVELGSEIFGALIDGYCEVEMVDESLRLLSLMEKKGLVICLSAYEMVISSLCQSNRIEDAKLLLSPFVKKGGTLESLSCIFLLEPARNLQNAYLVPEIEENDSRLYFDLIKVLQYQTSEPAKKYKAQPLDQDFTPEASLISKTEDEARSSDYSSLYLDLISVLQDKQREDSQKLKDKM